MARTRAGCREVTVVVGTAEAALGTQAESPTLESYHVARSVRTLGGMRGMRVNSCGILLSSAVCVGDPKAEADGEWEVDFEEIAVDLLQARFGNLAVDLLRCELMA